MHVYIDPFFKRPKELPKDWDVCQSIGVLGMFELSCDM